MNSSNIYTLTPNIIQANKNAPAVSVPGKYLEFQGAKTEGMRRDEKGK